MLFRCGVPWLTTTRALTGRLYHIKWLAIDSSSLHMHEAMTIAFVLSSIRFVFAIVVCKSLAFLSGMWL